MGGFVLSDIVFFDDTSWECVRKIKQITRFIYFLITRAKLSFSRPEKTITTIESWT